MSFSLFLILRICTMKKYTRIKYTMLYLATSCIMCTKYKSTYSNYILKSDYIVPISLDISCINDKSSEIMLCTNPRLYNPGTLCIHLARA